MKKVRKSFLLLYNMNTPDLYTDKILGNEFQIYPLPSWGVSIVSYNRKRRVLVKKIFRARLEEADREINITYVGLFGIRKFRYNLEGELLKFRFLENLEFSVPHKKFIKVTSFCRCLVGGVRIARNETKLLYRPYRVQRDQVRLSPLELKLKPQRQISNFIQE